MAELENTGKTTRVDADTVARYLSLSRVKAKHYLDMLVDLGYAWVDYEYIGDEHFYELTTDGRALLVEHELI